MFLTSLWVSLPAAAQPLGPEVEPLACPTTGQHLNGETGTQLVVLCPRGCGEEGVWGVDPFTDDSSVCSAAVFAGVLEPESPGIAVVTIGPEQAVYDAGEQYGVQTESWGAWGRSMSLDPPDEEAFFSDLRPCACPFEGPDGVGASCRCDEGKRLQWLIIRASSGSKSRITEIANFHYDDDETLSTIVLVADRVMQFSPRWSDGLCWSVTFQRMGELPQSCHAPTDCPEPWLIQRAWDTVCPQPASLPERQ